MKKKRIYRVRTQYTFEGVFEVLADSKENARQKVLQNCRLVMDDNTHSTLLDEEANWAFDRHPNKRIDRITKVQNILLNNVKSHANRDLRGFFSLSLNEQATKAKKQKKVAKYIHILTAEKMYFIL